MKRLHGYATYDGRAITMVEPGYALTLYRTATGNGLSDAESTDEACSWCGENPGRLYCYDATLDQAQRRDASYRGELFCSLHCWGQDSGYTDL